MFNFVIDSVSFSTQHVWQPLALNWSWNLLMHLVWSCFFVGPWIYWELAKLKFLSCEIEWEMRWKRRLERFEVWLDSPVLALKVEIRDQEPKNVSSFSKMRMDPHLAILKKMGDFSPTWNCILPTTWMSLTWTYIQTFQKPCWYLGISLVETLSRELADACFAQNLTCRNWNDKFALF